MGASNVERQEVLAGRGGVVDDGGVGVRRRAGEGDLLGRL